MSRKETDQAELFDGITGDGHKTLRPADSTLADQDLSDLCPTQLLNAVFVRAVFVEHCEPISETNIDPT